MTFVERSDATDRVLVVGCMQNIPETLKSRAECHPFCEDANAGCAQLLENQFDCVIVLADPSHKDSIKELEEVSVLAREQGTPLFSVAVFNPKWIYNLMEQLGVVAHFTTFPNHGQIAEMLAEMRQSSNEQYGVD